MASARTPSTQVLLTVGPQRLRLKLTGDAHSFEVPFDASAFDPRRPGPAPRLNGVQAQGEALWAAAFSGSLGLLLDRAAAEAGDTGAAITLRVVPAADLPPHLRWLPWETLFDPVRRDYLALKTGWSLVRGIDPFDRVPGFGDAPGVLVLAAPGSPAADEEVESIRRAVAGRGPVDVRRPADGAGLLDALRTGGARVVHVVGCGQGDGLVLPDPGDAEGGEEFVAGREIAEAVAADRHVALVVLGASSSARVGEAIARTARVTVLAHHNLVRQPHAAGLAEVFYGRLFDGSPVDTALTEARRGLDRQFPGERAWTSAVLLTGWPPPALPRPVPAAGAGTAAPGSRADHPVSAEGLLRLLHRTNLDRTRDLLAVADWDPLRHQHEQAEHRLAVLPDRAAP